MISTRQFINLVWVFAALLVSVSSAQAQWWYGNQYAGPGGYLHGTSDIISSTGDLLVKNQQAYTEQQKAEQAKIDTKKKSFDEMMYEKANTATYTEKAQYKKELTIHRLMTNPEPAEIRRGETLNALLPVIRKLSLKGVVGPPIMIDPSLLQHINYSMGPNSPQLGMLKDPSQLDWPLVLQGPEQEKIVAFLPTVVNDAVSGKLKLSEYQKLAKQVQDFEDSWRMKFRKEEIDGGTYITGKRFLDSLDQSVKGLQGPGVRKVLAGGVYATGNNVPELADSMASKGLTFAPANPGDELAYQALHNDFVAYTSAALSASGFQMRFNPPRTDPYVQKSMPSFSQGN
jgi:hypothetical protein